MLEDDRVAALLVLLRREVVQTEDEAILGFDVDVLACGGRKSVPSQP